MERIAIIGVEIDAGKARLRADLCFRQGETHGLIHGRYGILVVAAELHGDKETLHVTSPRQWFEKNRAEFECGSTGSQTSDLMPQ